MKQAVVSKVAVVTVGRIGCWNVVTMNCAVSESLVRINCGSFLCQFGRCRSKCTNDRKKRMANIVDRQLVKCNCDGSSCCVVRSSQRKFCVYVCDSHSHSQVWFFWCCWCSYYRNLGYVSAFRKVHLSTLPTATTDSSILSN